jgi:hypothetical protein
MRNSLGLSVIAAVAGIVAACGVPTDAVPPTAQTGDPPMPGSFTQGRARTLTDNLLDCAGGRVAAVGTITAHDDTTWIVPAETAFQAGPRAADLYNECGGTMLASSAEIDLEPIPITEIDPAGEVVTAYIFADNYFELYVAGTLVAVDPVPFTPFNSNVVRFRAQRPFDVAVMLVDWEENLGLGSEQGRGSPFHPGDRGLVARFEDDAGRPIGKTSEDWKALTLYIAPFADPECLAVQGMERLSRDCLSEVAEGEDNLHAVHWALPEEWAEEGFDDRDWPQASTFSNETVGVDNKPAYTNFLDIWDDPEFDPVFIWSDNLVLDNLVLVRGRIDS